MYNVVKFDKIYKKKFHEYTKSGKTQYQCQYIINKTFVSIKKKKSLFDHEHDILNGVPHTYGMEINKNRHTR